MDHRQDRNAWTRRRWLGLLAQSPTEAVLELWQERDYESGFSILREAEVGSVMVRGRMGGDGDAFNLGEMTVTRCSVTLEDGTVGHGYIQGRSKRAAEVVALCDALLQTDVHEPIVRGILAPLDAARREREAALRSKAAATRVEFFTLVRGED